MRHLAIFCCLISLSCSSNKRVLSANETKLVGKWIYQTDHGDRGGGENRDVYYKEPKKINKHIRFYSNGKLGGSYLTKSGSYELVKDTLRFHFGKTTSNFHYYITDKHLIISPIPLYCDEGCSEHFSKVN